MGQRRHHVLHQGLFALASSVPVPGANALEEIPFNDVQSNLLLASILLKSDRKPWRQMMLSKLQKCRHRMTISTITLK